MRSRFFFPESSIYTRSEDEQRKRDIRRRLERERGRFAKVCLVGDMGVGKTSLAIRFVHGDFFLRYRAGFSVNHFVKPIEAPDCSYNMLIWDTAGTERYRSLTSHYVRGACAVLLVFDVTARFTFDDIVSYWLPKIQHWQPGIPAILVANKVDQVEQDGWAVSIREILRFCARHQLRFYETSAVTGQNVEMCFLDAGNIIGELPFCEDETDNFQDSFELLAGPKKMKTKSKKKKNKLFDCCSIS